jgi:uncharacterized protein YbjT (DUF2867 family)
MKIAVAGATGRVGRHVVDVLEAGKHEVVAMSRAHGVDVISGKGLAQALTGVEAVIDVASGPSPEQDPATKFFTTASRNLQRAGNEARVQRMIVISIIGVDRFTAGYMAAKVAHEKAMLDGPVPVRILRAAQLHEFVETLMQWGRKGDVSYMPKMRTQLVAARTVAEVLVTLATDPTSASASASEPPLEIGGPKAEDLVDAARRLVARRGDPVRIEGAVNPGDPDSAVYEAGALLPGARAILAGPTFDAWLVAHVKRERSDLTASTRHD